MSERRKRQTALREHPGLRGRPERWEHLGRREQPVRLVPQPQAQVAWREWPRQKPAAEPAEAARTRREAVGEGPERRLHLAVARRAPGQRMAPTHKSPIPGP